MTAPLAALGAWLAGHVPNREALARNRYVQPFAHRVLRADLWRFTRRSVPRGIALGFFMGVVIPFAHTLIAALMAVVVRANVPVAMAATWISNPFTWVLMWPLAYRIGEALIRLDLIPNAVALSHQVAEPVAGAGHHHHLAYRMAEAGLATAFGLFVEAAVLALAGYLLGSVLWRLRIVRKRRGRRRSGFAPGGTGPAVKVPTA